MSLFQRTLWMGLLVGWLAQLAMAADPLPLGKVEPLTIKKLEFQSVVEAFDSFEHAPVTQGFSALPLPFRAAGGDPQTTANEAQAMAFLLSDLLDWSPGSYSGRHAFFVFKRDANRMGQLTKSYDSTIIKKAIADWSATHAIGGELRKSEAGYAGQLEIFDATGKRLLHQKYTKPQPFFDLLGTMAADAMKALDVEPHEAMKAMLRQPRCAHHESLALLGSAAFPAQRDGDLVILQQVVKRDPSFSEARHWLANQTYWKTRDGKAQERETRAILQQHRPTPSLIHELDDDVPYDARTLAALERHLEELSAVLPEESPLLTTLAHNIAAARGKVTPELMDRVARTVARHPNSHFLAHELMDHYWSEAGGFDMEMAASVAVLLWTDRYQPGTGKAHDLLGVANVMQHVGRPNVTAWALSAVDEREKEDADHQTHVMALFNSGAFREVVDYVVKHPKQIQPKAGTCAFLAIQAAGLVNDRKAFDALIAKYGQPPPGNMTRAIYDAYRGLMDKGTIDAAAVTRAGIGEAELVLLLSQLDLIGGTSAHRARIDEWTTKMPLHPLCWMITDLYERQQSTELGSSMYHAMEWLCPDHDWLTKRSTESKARSPKPLPDVDAVLQEVNGAGPAQSLPHAWRVASAVRTLLDEDRKDDAIALAERYTSIAAAHWQARVMGQMLVRRALRHEQE